MAGRLPRRAGFVFEPEAVLYDEAVDAMNDSALAAYFLLICHAWNEKEPGVMPYTPERFARLTRRSVRAWKVVEGMVSHAFDTTSRPGSWSLNQMVSTLARQNLKREELASAGRAGGLRSAEIRRERSQVVENYRNGSSEASSTHRTGSGVGVGVGILKDLSGSATHSPNGDVSEIPDASVDDITASLARVLAMPQHRQPPPTVKFDPNQVQERLLGFGKADARRLFELAGWFWKSGTRDMRLVLDLLEHAITNRRENWFAYYEPNGPARLEIEAKSRERIAAADKKAWAK